MPNLDVGETSLFSKVHITEKRSLSNIKEKFHKKRPQSLNTLVWMANLKIKSWIDSNLYPISNQQGAFHLKSCVEKSVLIKIDWTANQPCYWLELLRRYRGFTPITVFPHIRPAGIIFLQSLQLRVLLECGYYSMARIIS